MREDDVESVAQAFYAAEKGEQDWLRAPESLRQRYRREARSTITSLEEYKPAKRLLSQSRGARTATALSVWLPILSALSEIA